MGLSGWVIVEEGIYEGFDKTERDQSIVEAYGMKPITGIDTGTVAMNCELQ